ncbi:protein kinase C [Metarhizium album ARSEF 1941]|uniref:Protein kinase C-like n=1 Tax=Metarhizium album (strain ARSEF 1941) TaxID=1081103 RepID=A0A0B2WSF1_METAS|nr:protein kinase C [Metarhizium album ARSEF 1941]KHN99001.1 protein kinase C [Metarhizium album ARSEF 1941]
MGEDEKKIQDIHKKIEREKNIINAAQAMRSQTTNEAVRSRLDTQLRDGRRNLQFFEEKLRDIQMRQVNQDMGNVSLGAGAGAGHGPPPPPPKDPSAAWGGDQGGYGTAQYSQLGQHGDLMPPRHPYAPAGPGAAMPKSRPNFTKLDLIKYDTPYLGPRIQLMLSQIQFKLNVEEQYLKGVEKMVQLYGMEGDRRSKAVAAGRKVESKQKIVLLKQALKRYEELHIDMDSADSQDDDSINTPNLRKPLSGQLSIRVKAVKDVDHAATGRLSRGPETFVAVKVEDAVVARTKTSRTDRWDAEYHTIDVDKANEIELTVYDKPGEHPMPIGLLWVRISDIVEEMRRKRIEAEMNSSGWVSADQMATPSSPPGQLAVSPTQPGFGIQGHGGDHSSGFSGGPPPHVPQQPQINTGPIDAWFNLEPTGQIQLQMSFVKQNKDRRPVDLGLGRKGAVRQRKEEVHEMYGHKFVQHQFYNIMRCALCGDFLKYSAGMQCEDCKYTCHTKCYDKVVTKCISKSNAETDPDEEKINHRIPHRFQPFSNMTANWCCHCGYILPFGKKNCRKCSECGLTCHAHCAHLVPDFCGMSMALANQILEGIRTQKRQTKASSMSERTLRPSSSKPGSTASPPPAHATDASKPYTAPSTAATEAAKLMYAQPTSPTQQRPPAPDRLPSAQAAKAAQAALGGATSAQAQHQRQSDYGRYGGYDQEQPGDHYTQQYGGPAPQPHQPQHPQQRPYNPADYLGYAGQPSAQARPPVQQLAAQQQPVPLQQSYPPAAPIAKPEVVAAQRPQSGPVAGQPKQLPLATDPGTGQRIGLDHFNFLAVLGKGNFGKVMLAETKRSRRLYAIKVLKKEFIIENDEVESIRSEKRVFLIANKERHPFLTNLHACFQTETRVYFVMEYVSGGDLMLHIQRGQFGTKRAQFYAAEVCLALKYFHENGVIYRDLKLDNIMLTLDGHIKVADYGLCKEDMWYGKSTSTFCGTPEFMAPEILMDKKYGRAVDWWAFGVLIYQMLLQQSPFRGEDEDEIYDAIIADEPLYPIHMPRDSVSILQKLLTREPEQRLGSGPTDAQEVMSQPFFRNINWDDIYHKRVAPPFKPTIKSATDTSNFDSEFTSVTPVLTPVQSVLSQAMQEEFRGFSYTADFE